jgi:sugar phosphate isomerase/epimerase
MYSRKDLDMELTRRQLGEMALAAIPMAGTPLTGGLQSLQSGRPGSRFGGVQVGIIAGSFRRLGPSVEDVLRLTAQLGLNVIELDVEFFEPYFGAPKLPPPAGRGAPPPTAEETRSRDAARQDLRIWRESAPLDRMRALRQMYESAGVSIEIVKFPDLGAASMTDGEIDYCFTVAKQLGARAITCEPPLTQSKRLGRFADKHQLFVAYHNHANVSSVEAFGRTGAWEQAFFYSDFNWANVDVGHFTAGNGFPPIDFLREYHDRITNIHLKDRKIGGPNMPWGEGDTPLRAILQMMKREGFQFTATIELEYPIPEGSSVVEEASKCVQFCRDALA